MTDPFLFSVGEGEGEGEAPTEGGGGRERVVADTDWGTDGARETWETLDVGVGGGSWLAKSS